jgi:hypothetical protein
MVETLRGGTRAAPPKEEGGPTSSLFEEAQLLYRETPIEWYGDIRNYLEALELPVQWVKSFLNQINWAVYWEKRGYIDGATSYVIVRKRPVEPGNLWEETLLFEGGKILPEDAYV